MPRSRKAPSTLRSARPAAGERKPGRDKAHDKTHDKTPDKTPDKAADRGPLESLGEAISEPVTGSPRRSLPGRRRRTR